MHRLAYFSRALRLGGINVLLIDTDVFIFRDPYKYERRACGEFGGLVGGADSTDMRFGLNWRLLSHTILSPSPGTSRHPPFGTSTS